ncbi:hypothetical protein HK405_014266, partial [Cladochytrium tenue]
MSTTRLTGGADDGRRSGSLPRPQVDDVKDALRRNWTLKQQQQQMQASPPPTVPATSSRGRLERESQPRPSESTSGGGRTLRAGAMIDTTTIEYDDYEMETGEYTSLPSPSFVPGIGALMVSQLAELDIDDDEEAEDAFVVDATRGVGTGGGGRNMGYEDGRRRTPSPPRFRPTARPGDEGQPRRGKPPASGDNADGRRSRSKPRIKTPPVIPARKESHALGVYATLSKPGAGGGGGVSLSELRERWAKDTSGGDGQTRSAGSSSTQRSGYDDIGRGTGGGGSKSARDFRSPIGTA